MEAGRKVVTCRVCGHKMVIPAGYENTPGKCRICGATVNDGTESILEVEIRRPRPVMPPKKSNPAKAGVHAVLWGLLWGLAGAVVAGILMAVVLMLRGKMGESFTVKTFFANADTGILVGFVLCSSWTIIRRLAAGPFLGLLVGAGVSVSVGILCHVLEANLVATPNASVLTTAVVALLGGSVVGLIIGAQVGRPDDD